MKDFKPATWQCCCLKVYIYAVLSCVRTITILLVVVFCPAIDSNPLEKECLRRKIQSKFEALGW
jgi:hypothetical protein